MLCSVDDCQNGAMEELSEPCNNINWFLKVLKPYDSERIRHVAFPWFFFMPLQIFMEQTRTSNSNYCDRIHGVNALESGIRRAQIVKLKMQNRIFLFVTSYRQEMKFDYFTTKK